MDYSKEDSTIRLLSADELDLVSGGDFVTTVVNTAVNVASAVAGLVSGVANGMATWQQRA
jgi:hypothetical protein